MISPEELELTPSAPRVVPLDEDDARVPLRLTVARGQLGIELYEPVELGPLTVARLSTSLPNLRFPLDLSGGVRVFRNRRGALEHVELRLAQDRLARWLNGRWRDMLGGLLQPVAVWTTPTGVAFGVLGADGSVAFELCWAPVDGHARCVVTGARSARVASPAIVVALQLVDTAFSAVIQRRGRIVIVEEVGRLVGRAVLPPVGARAPSAAGLRFGPLNAAGDELSVTLDTTFPPPEMSPEAARALELAHLTFEADEALARGDMEEGRSRLMSALERAPRHPDVVRTLAEIDYLAGGRAEAPLAMLAETLSTSEFGAVGAELLALSGDTAGARHALVAATNAEPYGPVAALWWARLAELQPSLRETLHALDEAVARAPAVERPRWARLVGRLGIGEVSGALADAEHLEAAARGSRAKHEACRRAASALLAHGFVRDAGRVFERALRYVPNDPEATAGLARSFLELGKVPRAVGLLERAIELGGAAGAVPARAVVDLARVLAEKFGDLPGAIARVRDVPSPAEEGPLARYLEATWRARLGDLAGASLSYARLRDVLAMGTGVEPRLAATWLVEAATFEADVNGDVVAAERHMALAIQLRPYDAALGDAYRAFAARVARRAASPPEEA